MGMGGIRELLDWKIWEWDLSFRWDWEWNGSGNEVIEMGGNWYEKSVPAHLYCKPLIIQDSCSWPYDETYDTQLFVGHGNRMTLG